MVVSLLFSVCQGSVNLRAILAETVIARTGVIGLVGNDLLAALAARRTKAFVDLAEPAAGRKVVVGRHLKLFRRLGAAGRRFFNVD